ncbi:MAG: hypothetical protein IPM64_11800 [Phycisphaerales bacterium]|nr:hypothetical protein [Phycisphaerales bacterium]
MRFNEWLTPERLARHFPWIAAAAAHVQSEDAIYAIWKDRRRIRVACAADVCVALTQCCIALGVTWLVLLPFSTAAWYRWALLGGLTLGGTIGGQWYDAIVERLSIQLCQRRLIRVVSALPAAERSPETSVPMHQPVTQAAGLPQSEHAD